MAKADQAAQDAKKCSTPFGQFRFVHVFTPFAFKPKNGEVAKEPKFGVCLVLTEKIAPYSMADLKRIAQVAALEKFGAETVKNLIKKGKWSNPWRKGAEYEDEYGAPFDEPDCIFINARSRNPPGVVDHRQRPITDQTAVYDGCIGRISVYAHAYDAMGNQGVTFFLNNVQKTGAGERITTRKDASDEFDAVEGEDNEDDADNLF